jgi:hypothetical protein
MKSILIVLFAAITSISNVNLQEAEKIYGTFVGYEDGVYVFKDSDGNTTEFNYLSDEARSKYDLIDDSFVNKQFIIRFTVDTELDEQEEEIQVSTIVDLLMPS